MRGRGRGRGRGREREGERKGKRERGTGQGGKPIRIEEHVYTTLCSLKLVACP